MKISSFIEKIKENKAFAEGLIWNYVSLVFMALGGLCFSILIGYFYDAEALGYFNTFYAVYIGASQIVVFGCHNAVTKKVAETPDDIGLSKSYLLTGSFISIAVSAILYFLGIAFLFVSNGKVGGYSFFEFNALILGTFVFGINKIVLGYLNGQSRMKEYAVFQTFRNIFISGFIVLIAVWHFSREYLVWSFFLAESLLLLCEIPSFLKGGFSGLKLTKEKIKEIFIFGYHIMPSNLVLELNSKADILCLSFITGDERLVGIYSFAILFAEGFYQVFVVVRRSINPKVTQQYLKETFREYYNKTNHIFNRIGYLSAVLCGVAILIVHRVACFIVKDSVYKQGSLALLIVSIAIIINFKSIIWGNALSQTGFPKEESLVNIVTILSNIGMNVLLISIWGMIGAALATGLSYFVFRIIQKKYIEKTIFVK